MTVLEDAIEKVETWARSLGRSFVRRCDLKEKECLSDKAAAWVLRGYGRNLILSVDGDFPYSCPRVTVEDFDPEHIEPHVERNGFLCLANFEHPDDPVFAAQSAVGQALKLLKENAVGEHDGDIEEDFDRYWDHYVVQPGKSPIAEIYPGSLQTGPFHYAFVDGRYRCITSDGGLARWSTNMTGQPARDIRRGALFAAESLPLPLSMPRDGSELLEFLSQRCPDGVSLLGDVLKQMPKEVIILLGGKSPKGREHLVAVRLEREDQKKRVLELRLGGGAFKGQAIPLDRLCSVYGVTPCRSVRMDAALSRLPGADQQQLFAKKVVIAGCGALGSSVARLLSQSGIRNFMLVDPEILGWENILRHELGASEVGFPKVKALAEKLRRDVPMMEQIVEKEKTVAQVLNPNPEAFDQYDLVICMTGSTLAERQVESVLRSRGSKVSIVFGWLEAHAVAAHALLCLGEGPAFADGLDEHGGFRMPASTGGKPPPPECGAMASPFGAIELMHGATLVARLAMDVLQNRQTEPTWRSWLADGALLADSEASWSEQWLAKNGKPAETGQIVVGDWKFG